MFRLFDDSNNNVLRLWYPINVLNQGFENFIHNSIVLFKHIGLIRNESKMLYQTIKWKYIPISCIWPSIGLNARIRCMLLSTSYFESTNNARIRKHSKVYVFFFLEKELPSRGFCVSAFAHWVIPWAYASYPGVPWRRASMATRDEYCEDLNMSQ